MMEKWNDGKMEKWNNGEGRIDGLVGEECMAVGNAWNGFLTLTGCVDAVGVDV
jgi:hypothetical protein